jgi:hypothetical protein
MEPPPFTWYEIYKDFLNGDLASVGEKTLIVFQIPQECYGVTFTFVLGIFIMLGMLTRMYPITTINIMKHLLGVSDEPSHEPVAPVIIIPAPPPTPAPAPPTLSDSEMLEQSGKKYNTKINRKITIEYKSFAPAVLNILGKDISAEAKVEQLMYKVEDLSRNAIIGYTDTKPTRSMLSLAEKYYPNEDEEEEDSD